MLRSLKVHLALAALGLSLVLGGCAARGGQAVTAADANLRFPGFCRCADAADLLAYRQRVLAMNDEELGAEYSVAIQALAKQKSDVARLRVAMLLSVPAAAFRDDARAAALAEEVAGRKTAENGPLKALASVIAAVADEQRRQEERYQKLNQRLQEEEKRADALQQKLNGLKAIDKNLLDREPAKPVKVK
jgi:hypothetical protein